MALDRIVDVPRRRRRRTVELVMLADRARDAGQWKLAAELYRKTLDRNPRDAAIWVQYGHALKESGELRDPDKLARAEAAYRTALSLDPGPADTYLQLGHVLKLQGKTEDAQAAYLRAFALDPSTPYPLDELNGLGWSKRELYELRSLVMPEDQDQPGTAPGDPWRSSKLAEPAPEINRKALQSAFSISSVELGSILAGNAASERKSISNTGTPDAPCSKLSDRDGGAGQFLTEAPLSEEADVLKAVVLAQRWDLAGVKEQLRDMIEEKSRLKANLTAQISGLETKLRDTETSHGDNQEAVSKKKIIQEDPPLAWDPHPLFDSDFYQRQAIGRGISLKDPLKHFIEVGGRLGLSPHPLFDSAYYLERNPDVARDGDNPLHHYMTWGDREGRDPNVLFSVAYYKAKAGIGADDNALLHYLSTYGLAGDPHWLFDTGFYVSARGSELPSGTPPLAHFLTTLEGAPISPFPLFDQNYYRDQLVDANRAGGPLLLHYLEQLPETAASPHPLFDLEFFHEAEGYSRPALVAFISNFRSMATNGYKLSRMHFREVNRDFCSISYLLDHPHLMNGFEIPLVHYVRNADADLIWRNGHSAKNAVEKFDTDPGPLYEPAVYIPSRILDIAREQVRRGARYLTNEERIFAGGTRRADGGLTALFESTAPRVTLRGDDRTVVDEVAKSRRLAVYAIYVPDGRLKSYHRAMLASLRDANYVTILVNSAMAGAAALASDALGLAQAVVIRSGQGRDFASWMIALAHFAPALDHPDHILLLNDSLIGPFGDLGSVLASLEDDPADFKGLTDSLEREYHLQSSLLMLSRDALFSGAFLNFFLNFVPAPTRDGVVREGEIGLSMQLIRAGVTISAKVPYPALIDTWLRRMPGHVEWAQTLPERLEQTGLSRLLPPEVAARFSVYLEDWLYDHASRLRSGVPCNPQHLLWDGLITSGSFPLVKKDLLLINPEHVPTIIRLCDILPRNQRREFAGLLRDLVPPLRDLPRSYLHLSEALVDVMSA
jgi:tetratricopeptide (TPR) repeat protein